MGIRVGRVWYLSLMREIEICDQYVRDMLCTIDYQSNITDGLICAISVDTKGLSVPA